MPAKTDDKVLPPPSWEKAFLPVDRVLVMVVVKKAVGIRTPPTCGLLRGELPTPRSDGMELLRLEFVLPPAARQSMAEKLLWGAVRKVSQTMQLPLPPGPRTLRQVVVQHGSVVALLAVPTAHAVEWLRGSGCGGLYLRPFWTSSTDASIGREKFQLLWLRGKADRGPELWEVFHRREGVAGLLLAGRDVALRTTPAANLVELQAQLDLSFGNAGVRFRQATVGQRWWRLGPLTEAECWRALELVRAMGLEPLRGELRHARMGRWRHSVYFSAVGDPKRMTLDDGTRNCSEAFLQEASPPPRAPSRTVTAAPRPSAGPALATSSVWAGSRGAPVTSQLSPFQASVATVSPAIIRASQRTPQAPPDTAWPALRASSPSALPASQAPSQGRRRASRQRGNGVEEALPHDDPGSRRQLEELCKLVYDLREELRYLRRDNDLLRRRLQVAESGGSRPMTTVMPPVEIPAPGTSLTSTGVPSGTVRPATPPHDPRDLPPPPNPQVRPPLPPDPAEPSMARTNLGPREVEPGGSPDPKRKGKSRALVVEPHDDE